MKVTLFMRRWRCTGSARPTVGVGRARADATGPGLSASTTRLLLRAGATSLRTARADSTAGSADAPPVVRQGFLCLAYLGLNRPMPDSAGAYSVGLRAGSFLGYRVLRVLSLDAEMTIDLLHVNGPDSTGYNANEAIVDFTLSPLLHFEPRQSLVVVGPRLEAFRGNSATGYDGNEEAYATPWLSASNMLGPGVIEATNMVLSRWTRAEAGAPKA